MTKVTIQRDVVGGRGCIALSVVRQVEQGRKHKNKDDLKRSINSLKQ